MKTNVKITKAGKVIGGAVVGVFAINIAIVVAVVWVAYHFITKFW